MIGQLTGFISFIDSDHCLIDVQGVGYVVFASTSTLSALPRPPEVARLLIETIVREDAIQLFGFLHPEEKAWFRLLTTVQGVGARVALAILSINMPASLVQAVSAGDKIAFTRAAGVGPRLATRIVTELKGKITKIPGLVGAGAVLSPVSARDSDMIEGETVHHDALSALEGLGFRRVEAWPVVNRLIAENPDIALDEIIRNALKELAR